MVPSKSGKKPTIVFVTMVFEPETGNVRGLPLASWLARHGYDVKVITGFPNYPGGKVFEGYEMKWRQWETMEGVRVLRVPIYPSHDLSALRRITTYTSIALTSATIGAALIGRTDVAYLYDPPPTLGLASMVLKWFRGAKVVHHVGDLWPESATESGMVKSGFSRRAIEVVMRRWCSFLYRRADFMTALSPGFERILIERGASPEKIDIVYNWADESRFFPEERSAELARELGLEGKFSVVYAGNMGPLQSLDTAVRAAALLRDHPGFQLVFIGGGPKEAEIRELARSLELTNVKFVGRRPVTEMNAINAVSDALLVSLRDIPFMHTTIPSKTQVALASGRPVVMSVAGDAAQLIDNAGAGLTCPPENPAALAKIIAEMAAMPREAREAMGARGRAYYEQHLSLDAGASKMAEIFERVTQ